MIPIEKVICGVQSGGDMAGAMFAKKHDIDLGINVCKGFKPIGRNEIPGDLLLYSDYEVVTQKTGIPGLIERNEYNVENSDFTIILLNRDIYKTKGSKLTMNYCMKHHKAFFLYDICVTGMISLGFYNPHRFWEVIAKSIKLGEYRSYNMLTVNIAGPRDLDEKKGVRALEKMFYGGEKNAKNIGQEGSIQTEV